MLSITLRPRGGDWLEVDVAALSVKGVNVLVSLLENDEAAELGLVDESIAALLMVLNSCRCLCRTSEHRAIPQRS